MAILEISKISKKYRIQHDTRPYLSLRDKLTGWKRPFRSMSREDFWALQDVSFEVNPGDTIGLIGKNGAGKSTLLKILSKITPPTSGRITARGRIASLLEVGTGFHPELSGRENIFLNGSILGMRKREIASSLDAIIDFSGVERFLDTPLKNYSSGMQLRLAFAVAAFLEPEILIIDEVLAVGDAEFQRKCMSKMEDVSKVGRTILFVSHNMAAVKKLCKRGILLQAGKAVMDGPVQDVVDKYTQHYDVQQTEFEIPVNKKQDMPGFAHTLRVEDLDGNPCNEFPVGKGWQVRIRFTMLHRTPGVVVALGMLTPEDVGLRSSWSEAVELSPGDYEAVFREETLFLGAGYYKLIVGMSARMMTFQYAENCAYLRISEDIQDEERSIKHASGVGFVLNPMKITLTSIEQE